MILFAVKFPDIEKAEMYDKEFNQKGHDDVHTQLGIKPTYIDVYFENMTCKDMAINMREWLIMFILVHTSCTGVNIFREIYETKLGKIGQIMRGFEVISLGMYALGIIMSLNNISVFFYWERMRDKYGDYKGDMRQCFVDEEKLEDWSGTVIQFSMIEVGIYVAFQTTLVLLLIKSRFKKTGVDNSYQFEEVYMSYLLNKIIRNLLFKKG